MSPKKLGRPRKQSTEKLRIVRKEKAHKNKPANLKVSIPLQNSGKFESNNMQSLQNYSKFV